MKKIILFSLLFIATAYKSQNSVAYQYDNNGNRTQRYFVGLSFRVNPGSPAKDSAQIIQASTEIAMKYGLSVYPNPTKDAVNVIINKAVVKPDIDNKNNAYETTIVYLMDSNGKILAKQNYLGTENTFDMSKLLAGNYYVWVVFNNKENVYYEVIKVN